MVGKTISHYRILDKIGEGGMGVVYKAEETKLDRTVALKFLSGHLLENEEARERFVREGKAAATLDHPNICTVFEIDEVDGETFLAMAYIEGPTLKEKIDERPLKLKQALDIAAEIADGLAAAHDRGIHHRDIKPANVMLSSDGHVKIMDFGLAQLAGQTKITKTGMMLGTPTYMAPEQVRGEETDRRTDIWAFGVVLHEMITGQPPFGGETDESLGYAILHTEPEPLTALRSGVPVDLDRIVAKLMAKDPEERYQHIDEALVDLRALRKRLPETSGPSRTAAQTAPVKQARLPWVVAAFATLAAVLLVLLWLRQPAQDFPSTRFTVEAPPGAQFVFPSRRVATAVSPGGRYLVFAAETEGTPSLWLRPLDSLSARQLPGTEGGVQPFWSPDSTSVAFFADGKLKRIDIAGGAPRELCESPNQNGGGTWSHDGIILFGSNDRLSRVPDTGGAPQELTVRDVPINGAIHYPQFLPDGKHFLYFLWNPDPNIEGIYGGSLDDPSERTKIVSTQRKAYYVPPRGGRSGFLLWVRAQTLLAQPFAPGRMRLEGGAVPVVEDLDVPRNPAPHATFWVSDTGVLVYRTTNRGGGRTLTWLDRQGEVIDTAGEPRAYEELNLSPDGSRVAVFRSDGNFTLGEDVQQDLWLIDFARPGQDVRLTTGPANESYPVWSPDGKQIIFSSNRDSAYWDLYRTSAGGLGEGELLLKTDENKMPMDWSPDRQFLLFLRKGAATGNDLWVLPLEGGREPEPYLVTESNEGNAKFSPDGRWVVYTSDRTGEMEVYVSPFPPSADVDAMTMVSSGGGTQPRWRRDGKELFYLSPDNTLMAVEVATDPSFKTRVPSPLFNARVAALPYPGEVWVWDVTPDGERFLVTSPVESREVPPLMVVTNWQAVLPE